jgi:electron transfer flavoprotein alpha/beta subunit
MNLAIWLGTASPARSVRWLDGTLAAAKKVAKIGDATAIAAGESSWLDLAADRARHAGVTCVGVPTELRLDYLGWGQIAAAVVRKLGVTTILVDEASRPERFPEVAAIAELLDAAQLTRVVAIAAEGPNLHAVRLAGNQLQTLKVRGPAVIGMRIAGEPLDEYPTPIPSKSMKRFDLTSLGLDALVLGHRALPPRASAQPKKTVQRVADHLAVHLVARRS